MVFLKALDDVSAEERGTLALQCEVSDPQARVVWRKDSVELGPSDKYDFLHTAGTRGLVVHDLSRDDTGLYTCSVGSEETRARVSVHGAWLAPGQRVQRVQLWPGGGAGSGGRSKPRGWSRVRGAGRVQEAGSGPTGWSRVQEAGPSPGDGTASRGRVRSRGGVRSRGLVRSGDRSRPRGWSRAQGTRRIQGAGRVRKRVQAQEVEPRSRGGAGPGGRPRPRGWSQVQGTRRVQGRGPLQGAELLPGDEAGSGAEPVLGCGAASRYVCVGRAASALDPPLLQGRRLTCRALEVRIGSWRSRLDVIPGDPGTGRRARDDEQGEGWGDWTGSA